MSTRKKGRYLERFLKKADKAIDDGIKRADEILDDAVEFGVMASGQAKKTSTDLRTQAKKEGEELKTRGMKRLNEGISTARRFTASAESDLETLERLAKLRKEKVITQKEFEEKKRKILSRI